MYKITIVLDTDDLSVAQQASRTAQDALADHVRIHQASVARASDDDIQPGPHHPAVGRKARVGAGRRGTVTIVEPRGEELWATIETDTSIKVVETKRLADVEFIDGDFSRHG